MTGDFVIDLLIVVIGLPVLLGVGGDVAKRWIRMREREMELKVDRAEAQSGEYREIIGRLEERLCVLERIATDRSVNLANQIEALRDTHNAEQSGERGMPDFQQKETTR